MRSAWLAVLLLGCSSSDALPPPEVQLFVGQELDTWAAAPAATRVRIDLVSLRGNRTKLTEGAAPAPKVLAATTPPTTMLLPEQRSNDPMVAQFEATATDASANVVVRGTTVPFTLFGIEAISVPVFLGRVGLWSRPPDTLEHAHLHAATTVVLHEYVIAAGGDPIEGANLATPDFYDGAMWRTLRSQPPFPRPPKSMGAVGAGLLLVDDGSATWINLTNDDVAVASPPGDLQFSDIAGGDTLTLDDGSFYIVGATRVLGDPTSRVLRVNRKGEMTALTLATPRLGAGATLVGSTLVVTGGSDQGSMAEALASDQTTFSPIPLPADATSGLGAAALDTTTVVVAGGKDPATGAAASVRTFDPSCTADCMASEITTLPVPLARTKVFAIGPKAAMVLGEAENGENRAFLIDASTSPGTALETILREPRRGATPLLLPNRQAALLGGQLVDGGGPASTLETFIP